MCSIQEMWGGGGVRRGGEGVEGGQREDGGQGARWHWGHSIQEVGREGPGGGEERRAKEEALGLQQSQEVQHSSAWREGGEGRASAGLEKEGSCLRMPLMRPAHHQLTRPRLPPAPFTIPSHPPTPQELTKSMSTFGYEILQALVNDIIPAAKVSGWEDRGGWGGGGRCCSERGARAGQQ